MVDVYYLRDFKEIIGFPSVLVDLERNQVPEGGTLSFTHKFVLGESALEGVSPKSHLVLAIGPTLKGDGYFHRDIFRRIIPVQTLGGGSVTFTGIKDSRKVTWSAIFKGQSGDYGPFDTAIITKEHVNQVANILEMYVTFECSVSAVPQKK